MVPPAAGEKTGTGQAFSSRQGTLVPDKTVVGRLPGGKREIKALLFPIKA